MSTFKSKHGQLLTNMLRIERSNENQRHYNKMA